MTSRSLTHLVVGRPKPMPAGVRSNEASMSFLGLGNMPPSPWWGSMVSSSYGFLETDRWPTLF
ncbi:MAG: hypothetical protein JO352_26040 [Chloroflexi bacterium]|nr:hypothetical protein [Chloroflexota bacterium]